MPQPASTLPLEELTPSECVNQPWERRRTEAERPPAVSITQAREEILRAIAAKRRDPVHCRLISILYRDQADSGAALDQTFVDFLELFQGRAVRWSKETYAEMLHLVVDMGVCWVEDEKENADLCTCTVMQAICNDLGVPVDYDLNSECVVRMVPRDTGGAEIGGPFDGRVSIDARDGKFYTLVLWQMRLVAVANEARPRT